MQVRPRLLVLIAALVVTSCFAWWMTHRQTNVRAQRRQPTVWRELQPVQPRPDARALIAVADIRRLITGGAPEAVEAEFMDGRWQVRCAGLEAGSLSATPDFSELRTMLAGWCSRLGADSAFAAAGPTGARSPAQAHEADARIVAALESLRPLAALQDVDREWSAGRRDARLRLAASRAGAMLLVQTVDHVGASDTLAARALALSVLAGHGAARAALRDECLIADDFGYGAEACAMAARLPEGDAARWFVMRVPSRLAAVAATSRSHEARFLRLASVARSGDLEQWSGLADREERALPTLALPLLSSGLMLGRFESRTEVGGALLMAVARDVGISPAPPRGTGGVRSMGEIIDSFEALVEGLPGSSDGPVLDRAVVRSYYRSAFYSGLRSIGDHLLHALSSTVATEELAADMASDQAGAGAEFKRWFSHLSAAKRGLDVSDSLNRDLTELRHFGAPLRFASYGALDRWSIEHKREHPAPAARRLIAVLDSRPEHLRWVSILESAALSDLVTAEGLDSTLALRVHPADVSWWMWRDSYTGRADHLLALARDPERSPKERVAVLKVMDEGRLGDSTAVESAHAGLAAEFPSEFIATYRYAGFLEERARGAEARRLMEHWLARPDRSDRAFEEIFARTLIARLYRAEGRHQAGLAVIEPVVGSWQRGALAQAALLFDDAGRAGAAESLAVAAWQRYPDSPDAQALVVRLFWRHRRDALAARALAARGALRRSDLLREQIVPVIRERFTREPAGIAAMVDAAVKVDPGNAGALRVLSEELDRAGDHRLAFEVASRLDPRGDESHQVLLRAYGYLERSRGREAAAAWFAERTRDLDPMTRSKVLTTAFGEEAGSLVWTASWSGLDAEDQEYLWMLRAAVAMRGDVTPDRAQREAMERHFATRGTSHYRVLGRYLLGREDLAATLAAVSSARARSEAFYFIGLKAQTAGDIREAARWYARCAALRQRGNAEDFWARMQVQLWQESGKSLDRIAEEARRLEAHRDTGGAVATVS